MVRRTRVTTIVALAAIVASLCVGSIVGPAPSAAADRGATEYQVKAVYLYNFARFVTWPDSAFVSPTSPLTLCVLGDDPFGAALDQALANETVGGRSLAARRIANADAAAACQVLFVNAGAASTHVALLRTLRDRPILTVGDDEAFPTAGGMVGFRLEEDTVHITVNQGALREAGLTMSSQLLRIARLVPERP
jgi:uncharacterized protein DUF4154